MLPNALKSCLKCKKLPNLVTLAVVSQKHCLLNDFVKNIADITFLDSCLKIEIKIVKNNESRFLTFHCKFLSPSSSLAPSSNQFIRILFKFDLIQTARTSGGRRSTYIHMGQCDHLLHFGQLFKACGNNIFCPNRPNF